MKRLICILLILIPTPAFAGIFGDSPECVVGGCSGQLCIDMRNDDGDSTCEWTEAYGCYHKFGECKIQDDDKCGWTPSESLLHCLTYPKLHSMDYPEPEESPLNELILPRKPELNP